MNVLIIEDDAGCREVLRLIVESHGDTVVEARDGLEGVNLALSTHPDVVFSDINMPRMDGYGVARALAAARPDLRIVALTASSDRRAPLAAGFHRVLLKPARLADIFDALDCASRDCGTCATATPECVGAYGGPPRLNPKGGVE